VNEELHGELRKVSFNNFDEEDPSIIVCFEKGSNDDYLCKFFKVTILTVPTVKLK
jgi:hypothetical protein